MNRREVKRRHLRTSFTLPLGGIMIHLQGKGQEDKAFQLTLPGKPDLSGHRPGWGKIDKGIPFTINGSFRKGKEACKSSHPANGSRHEVRCQKILRMEGGRQRSILRLVGRGFLKLLGQVALAIAVEFRLEAIDTQLPDDVGTVQFIFEQRKIRPHGSEHVHPQ